MLRRGGYRILAGLAFFALALLARSMVDGFTWWGAMLVGALFFVRGVVGLLRPAPGPSPSDRPRAAGE